jgi:catechol 2,3-dioxygenase-like lactoylglutathione lyase family enzyme
MSGAMEIIDHLDLVVSDLDRSLTFYTGLLRPFGYVRTAEIEGERGERVVYIGRPSGSASISLRKRHSENREIPYDRYDLGIHHIALAAHHRDMVDERARWIADNGGTIESGPEEYDYTPGYYAVFFHDPDGIKLEIVHRPREQDLVNRIAALEARLAEAERR